MSKSFTAYLIVSAMVITAAIVLVIWSLVRALDDEEDNGSGSDGDHHPNHDHSQSGSSTDLTHDKE